MEAGRTLRSLLVKNIFKGQWYYRLEKGDPIYVLAEQLAKLACCYMKDRKDN